MPILNVELNQIGQAGIFPSLIFIQTNDTVAEVLAPGYLNGVVHKFGIPLSELYMAIVSTKTSPNADSTQVGTFGISNSSGNWSLITTSSPADVTLPTTANHIATYTNATGGLSQDPTTAILNGGLQVGTNIVSETGNIIANSGNILATGNISTSVGNITSAGMLTASGNISTTGGTITATGDISTTAGNITSAGTLTASGNISTTGGTITATGNISTTAGNITSAGTITATNDITTSAGNIIATAGNITAHGDIFANLGAFVAGLSSGTQGLLTLFSPTANNGKLVITCSNAGTNSTTTIQSSTMGQSTSYTIGDIGASTGGIPVSTFPILIKSAPSAPVAGGSSTVTITDPFCTTSSNIQGTFKTSTNLVTILRITPSNGSFVVNCSGDPGVSTFNYVVIN